MLSSARNADLLSGQHFAYRGGHGPLKLLREISMIPEALRRLTRAIDEMVDRQEEAPGLEARLEEIERTRSLWEAEISALILEAKSQYRAASNAESRARTVERRNAKDADPFDENRSEAEEPVGVPRLDAPPSGEEEMYALPLGVASPDGRKASALRFKFGGYA